MFVKMPQIHHLRFTICGGRGGTTGQRRGTTGQSQGRRGSGGVGRRRRQAARAENPYCSADVSFITLSTYRRYHGLRDHRSNVSSLDTAR